MQINVIRADQLTPDDISTWAHLHELDPAASSPFLRPEFVLAAGRVRANVEVAIMRAAGEIVGFFPFERDQPTVGRAVAWELSDGDGVVTAPGTNWSPEELVLASGLSVWHFEHLDASQAPFRPYQDRLEPAAYMDLMGGFEVYRQSQIDAGSKTIRQTERKARKMGRELGPVRLEMHAESPEVLESLLTWKSALIARWNLPDVFRHEWVAQLIGAVCGVRSDGFTGFLTALYAGDRPVAAHVGLRSHGLMTSWIPAYDATLAKYSPGLIMHVEMAKRAADLGIDRIDLGRGVNQMKASLMSGTVPLAIGSVDRSRARRTVRKIRYRAEDFATTHLSGAPRRLAREMLFSYRSIRNRLVDR